jgi:hypothetical protein|tara:strand:+ start:552 stop:1304 length:753 start_codon:yes stop_codon:yes gene_type:complete
MAWQDEYDQVEDRLKKFWKDNPSGRIYTEILHISEDFNNAVHRCEVYIDFKDEFPVATGIAQDQHGSVGANKTSWIENGETSAIGRALANWIYAAKKRPSVTEMQKVENLSKVTKSVGKTSNSNTYTPSPAIQEKIKDVPKGPVTDLKKDLEEIGVAVTEKVMVTNGSVEPKCLSCNSDLWDNRIDKASGKIKDTYPDWKCKNKECDNGNPRIYYMDSFNAAKQAPEEWFMPDLPKAKALEDIGEDEAPF